MTAEELFRRGDLEGALAELENQIRQEPTAPEPRIFHAQLLMVLGEWERAELQLKAIGDLEPKALPMALTYRGAIAAERSRERIFRGEGRPHLFGEPQAWMALLVEALQLAARGEIGASQELRRQAFDQAPAIPGKIGERDFDWIADGDMRLGPMVELILSGRYGWAPFLHIARLDFEEPSDLRDLIWLPVHIAWRKGGEGYGLMPARYPFSYGRGDPDLSLSRKTVWEEVGQELYIGYGQKMWATDRAEFSALEVRRIELEPPPVPEAL